MMIQVEDVSDAFWDAVEAVSQARDADELFELRPWHVLDAAVARGRLLGLRADELLDGSTSSLSYVFPTRDDLVRGALAILSSAPADAVGAPARLDALSRCVHRLQLLVRVDALSDALQRGLAVGSHAR